MAASQRAATPAAARLQSPGDSSPGAQAAQSQREDPSEAATAAAAALRDEEDGEEAAPRAQARTQRERKRQRHRRREKQAPCQKPDVGLDPRTPGSRPGPKADFNTNISEVDEQTQISNEDFVDFSDICHSNEEYFRKLEELKAAHLETMAKLEKMYQNKLNLKVQPVIIREEASSVSSRSESEKNSYHPISLMTSSEPDLGPSSSLIMSSSEDELPNLEKEYPEKKRVVMSYAKELINNMWTNFSVEDYIRCEDAYFPAVEKTKKKPREWVPKITVPEPFQMMIREQRKKEENMKSKSDIEMVHQLLKKQEEESECKKKFRATPVPAFVFFPLYHDLVKQNEDRRKRLKEKNKEALLASQKPFKFIAREEQKQAIREKKLRDLFKSKKKTNRFKARPVPRSTYGSATKEKLKEEELYRDIMTQLKAQELLQNPSPLPSRSGHKSCAPRKLKRPEQPERLKCTHKFRCQIADFEKLPEGYQKHLSEQKCSKLPASHKPPNLHAASTASTKREKILADIAADEEHSKETRSFLSPRNKSPGRSASAKPVPCNCPPPMPTVSSRGREQATRKSEKERMREYQQELEEREEKLKNRPLLFERVAQKNARMAAEKRYSNTLKALGLSDEFVSKKGQSGKVFEYFSNQEMKNFTEDKERFVRLQQIYVPRETTKEECPGAPGPRGSFISAGDLTSCTGIKEASGLDQWNVEKAHRDSWLNTDKPIRRPTSKYLEVLTDQWVTYYQAQSPKKGKFYTLGYLLLAPLKTALALDLSADSLFCLRSCPQLSGTVFNSLLLPLFCLRRILLPPAVLLASTRLSPQVWGTPFRHHK
ncbi:protein FAM161A isoform X3 [Canis lupus baileyi]|uniref:protein FAM161A isoform X3 n=1 Tax=Canis lupus baileyi TaxID=143281 RepID=UPI003B97C6D1